MLKEDHSRGSFQSKIRGGGAEECFRKVLSSTPPLDSISKQSFTLQHPALEQEQGGSAEKGLTEFQLTLRTKYNFLT